VSVPRIDGPRRANINENGTGFLPVEQITGDRYAIPCVAIATEPEIEHRPYVANAQNAGVTGESLIKRAFPSRAQNRVPVESLPPHKVA